MKKMMFKTPIFAFLLMASFLQAQTDYHWDTYGVGFSIPDNFKVTTNNAETFEANNDNLFLAILPFSDENINKEDLAAATLSIAGDMQYDSLEDGGKIEIDDFEGYYVEGVKDGTNAVIISLLDKKSDTNLIVVIVYNDGYLDAAVDMAKSFYAYDK